MITKAQCRAARGLLGWTQQDLATAASLSKTAIINFERGLTDIKNETLRQIKHAFEKEKLQFGDFDRIQRREDKCQILEGHDKLFQILKDACSEAQGKKDEILISFLSEQEILKHNIESFYSIANLWEKTGVQVRYILEEGEFLYLQPFAKYRWVPEDVKRFATTSIIYGNKIAFRFWKSDTYITIENPDITKLEKLRFEELWKEGRIPTTRKNENVA